jgi:hypothetical protein
VGKAPASAANLGVRFFPHNEYIGYLQSVAPDLARFGVLEEFIDGPQYEIDGFVIGDEIGWFQPLQEHWDEAGERIIAYERREPSHGGWRDAALTAVRAIGVNDSPFCLEMRFDINWDAWRIIEAHARLGEDSGLSRMMSDEDPLCVIEKACRDKSNRNVFGRGGS